MIHLNNREKRFRFVRLQAIVRKEFIQIKKDPASLAIALVLPVLLLVLLGYAMNDDVESVHLSILDQSQTAESRELINRLTSQGDFTIMSYEHNVSVLEHLLDKGDIHAGLIIPANYSKELTTNTANVQFLIDGSDPTYAQEALFRSESLLLNYAHTVQAEQLIRSGTEVPNSPLKHETQVFYNPSMDSMEFNIPALIGLIMQEVTLILTAFALVREKEQGTIEQLIVTPIRPAELIIGKLVPYTIIGTLSFAFVLLAGVFWFDVAIAGDPFLLVLLSLLFLVATLAMGIFISTIAKNQLQAMYMSFAVILPSVILSGFVFPRESMPMLIQLLGGLIPLTYFLEILRGIFLKANSLQLLWPQSFVLLGFTVLLSIATIAKFKKHLQ
ncbi:ABC transporter permease [Shouchella clausii]|uniref:ABC transporter permease n=1 Tax=Shouchella TaxID=2893057 RepID=UPI0009E9659F|nr:MULTISPECIES: ABC transporter permease [Shouchella]MBU3229519.1 ABC transporter permease [Shouchella clausii]MBU3265258.1 ABC transporter permease [Shouchella clausii]MBU3506420.1 ABC transporter permease [Shouchella clausii]MBU3536513.1 ABC transporter permease [Shouchella clausii]MBX0307470.1 ABC transporter permease [Shouchella clausii]